MRTLIVPPETVSARGTAYRREHRQVAGAIAQEVGVNCQERRARRLGRLTSQMRLKAVAPMKPRMRAPQQPLLQLLDARLGEHFPRARYLLELLFVREIARTGRHFATFGNVILEFGDFAHSPGLAKRNRDAGNSFQGTKHSG
jgi:hypothetical protein